MKLDDEHHRALRLALAHGAFRPRTKAQVDACLELQGLQMLDAEDASGEWRFKLTTLGERFVAALREVPKSAKIYAFATHTL